MDDRDDAMDDMEEDLCDRPLLVFDGDCSFCKALVDYGKRITGERVRYAPYQQVGPRFPRIAPEDFASAVKLILPGGEVRSGAHAVFSALERTPGRGWMLELYTRIPGVAPIA